MPHRATRNKKVAPSRAGGHQPAAAERAPQAHQIQALEKRRQAVRRVRITGAPWGNVPP
jgi:hypothetical protein